MKRTNYHIIDFLDFANPPDGSESLRRAIQANCIILIGWKYHAHGAFSKAATFR